MNDWKVADVVAVVAVFVLVVVAIEFPMAAACQKLATIEPFESLTATHLGADHHLIWSPHSSWEPV